MNRTVDKLRAWLSVDLTLAEEVRNGLHDLDDDECRFACSLMDEDTSSYTDAEATHAVNILKKLLGTSESADEFYARAQSLAVAGTGNLLPIRLDDGLFDTLITELNERDHPKRSICIAAYLDWRNERLLIGTWNGLGHYGIKRDVEDLGVDSELIKLSVEHAEGADEVRITYFDYRAVAPFKPFKWFTDSTDENTFTLSKPERARRDTRLILGEGSGLSMHAIGFLGSLVRQFPDTKLLLSTIDREFEIQSSIIALMMTPLRKGEEFRIVAAGPDAGEVIERIEGFALSGSVFLKADETSTPSEPSRSRSVDVIVNEELGVHFRIMAGLIELAKACEGTKLYLTMDCVDRIEISPRSFSKLCSLGLPRDSRIGLSAEGPDAVTLIDRILDFSLDRENRAFVLCRPAHKKGPSGDDDPDGGTTPPTGGQAPSGNDAPPSSFKGISRSSVDAKTAGCTSYDIAAAETLGQKPFGPTIYDPLVLGAATYAASTARAI